MSFSTVPLLIAAIFGFLWFVTRRLHQRGLLNSPQRNWLAALLAILLVWAVLIGHQAGPNTGTLRRLLETSPGYWLPYAPLLLSVVLMLLNAPLRDALRTLVDGTPPHWLTGIHILRVLALGSLYKASQGQFPELFAWLVGLPDLLFGLSAIGVTWLARQERVDARLLLRWHLLGALVILTPLLGCMHLFMAEPLFVRLFESPMVFAPALLVPVLLMLNLLVAWRLWETTAAKA